MIDFKKQAESLKDELVARRRDFHMYPELGFEVHRTAGIIAEELRNLGLEVQTGVGKTGVVGILEGEGDGPTILYRSDMDALPILEENEFDFVSKNLGVMHACGHDGHMAIALGIVKLMSQHRDKIKGRIKFVFQPAEENGQGGARAMIRDGLLDNAPVPEKVFGLHLWNELPFGNVGVAKGAIMSGSSTFRIVVEGEGGHAAMPHNAIDPVACSGQLINALHHIVGRKMDAMAGAVVLTITSVHSSSMAYNIIPEKVELGGTFRTFNAYTSEMLDQHIQSISRSVCESAGCKAQVTIKHNTIPVVNDPDVTNRVRDVLATILEPDQLDRKFRTMASEDVAFMLDDIPGTFLLVGAASPERGLAGKHHHPRFNFDEDILPFAVAMMSAVLADYLMLEGKND